MDSYTWAALPTPVGKLLIVRSAVGLVRVAFDREDAGRLLDRLGGTHREAPDPEAAGQLSEYFRGARREFTLPLDWRLTGGFRGRVQRAMLDIPYGATESYGALARRLGHPNAGRAVGSGCANNPLPIVVPCHRVVRSDGSPGNYLAGPDVKNYLLEMEARLA